MLAAGFAAVGYLALVDPVTLRPLAGVTPGQPARLLAAVRLGSVRLLDNMPAGGAIPARPGASSPAGAMTEGA